MEDKCGTDIDETIAYYDQNATAFVEATINVDVSELYKPFEELLHPGAKILDLGCGSGRDSMLLATATPVQIDPIEAYDLLDVLGRPNDATKVLGDSHSVWRKTPQTGLDYISGEAEIPQTAAEMWSIVRNPFPQRSETNRRISTIRDQLDKPDSESVFKQDEFDTYRKVLPMSRTFLI